MYKIRPKKHSLCCSTLRESQNQTHEMSTSILHLIHKKNRQIGVPISRVSDLINRQSYLQMQSLVPQVVAMMMTPLQQHKMLTYSEIPAKQ